MSERTVKDIIDDLVPSDVVDRCQDPEAARRKAMDLLARREHAADELCRKLEKSGFEPEVTRHAVEQLKAEGLQSDERYVESFVRSRINQGKGPARIRADLRQKGVNDAIIEAALEDAGADWYVLAREIRSKKFGRELPAGFKEKARQMRFLQYRGFEPDQISAAVAASDD